MSVFGAGSIKEQRMDFVLLWLPYWYALFPKLILKIVLCKIEQKKNRIYSGVFLDKRF